MFIACGEALYDVFADPPAADGSMALRAVPGGSPYNVAIGLARLGVETGFLGGVSTDALGAALAGRLAREGVSDRFLIRRPEPTTLSLVSLGADGSPSYSFRGAGAADRTVSGPDLPALPPDCAGLHLGSYSLVVPPVGPALVAMAERARGLLVTFDPNVRTGVEPDMERWRAVFRRMAALCTVLKASEEDLALLHPETDPESLAEQAAGQGPALVVLTRGAGGAVAWHGRFRIDINAPAVTVADTVGAGDAFQAMLIAGLLANGARGAPSVAGLPAAILRRLVGDAVLAGSLACARPGADPPSSAELAAARAAHPGVTSFV